MSRRTAIPRAAPLALLALLIFEEEARRVAETEAVVLQLLPDTTTRSVHFSPYPVAATEKPSDDGGASLLTAFLTRSAVGRRGAKRGFFALSSARRRRGQRTWQEEERRAPTESIAMAWRSSGATQDELMDNLHRNGVIRSKEVLDVMKAVDRGHYITRKPYEDAPQAICCGATISAPHMHAEALEVLKDVLRPGNSALDVGSGTGYLTVCMAEMVQVAGKGGGRVAGIDYIKDLVELSRRNVEADRPALLQNDNFRLVQGNGWKGGPPDMAPFDAIHVGAAARTVPPALVQQLAVGGKMVVPVNSDSGWGQDLLLVTKKADGSVREERLLGVVFVPLVEPNDDVKA